MSATTTCPSCNTPVPAQAAFCTNCGHRMEAQAETSTSSPEPTAQDPSATDLSSPGSGAADPPPPPAPVLPPPASFSPPSESDATRVDTPGRHDSPQVYTPPSSSAPWQPADQGAPAPSGPPTTAPWSPPESPPPPPWQQQAGPTATEQPWGAPQSMQSPGSAPSSGKSPIGGLMAILGGIATLVGLFTPWLESNQNDDSASGWTLTSGWSPASGANELTSNDPYIVLGLGIAALVVGFMLLQGVVRPLARIAAMVIGLAVIGVLVYDWLQVTDHVSDMSSEIEVSQAFGYFVAIAGGVITALAALLPAKK